jgi:two-component system LytT family response regulator
VTRALRGAAAAGEPRIVVTTSRGTTVLRLSEIDWIQAADNYARLWVGGRSWLHREALSTLERRLRAHGFVRVHRQALVRVNAVRNVGRTRGGMVAELLSGVRVPVSRRRRALMGRAIATMSP